MQYYLTFEILRFSLHFFPHSALFKKKIFAHCIFCNFPLPPKTLVCSRASLSAQIDQNKIFLVKVRPSSRKISRWFNKCFQKQISGLFLLLNKPRFIFLELGLSQLFFIIFLSKHYFKPLKNSTKIAALAFQVIFFYFKK